jgi:hypothetical protein
MVQFRPDFGNVGEQLFTHKTDKQYYTSVFIRYGPRLYSDGSLTGLACGSPIATVLE